MKLKKLAVLAFLIWSFFAINNLTVKAGGGDDPIIAPDCGVSFWGGEGGCCIGSGGECPQSGRSCCSGLTCSENWPGSGTTCH